MKGATIDAATRGTPGGSSAAIGRRVIAGERRSHEDEKYAGLVMSMPAQDRHQATGLRPLRSAAQYKTAGHRARPAQP